MPTIALAALSFLCGAGSTAALASVRAAYRRGARAMFRYSDAGLVTLLAFVTCAETAIESDWRWAAAALLAAILGVLMAAMNTYKARKRQS